MMWFVPLAAAGKYNVSYPWLQASTHPQEPAAAALRVPQAVVEVSATASQPCVGPTIIQT